MPRISVIIPTCGRMDRLECLLAGLARTEPNPDGTEVLVVDTGGRPGLRELCAAMRLPGAPVRYVPCPSRALHAGRHWGARAATGDVLLYADDDIVPAEGWLAAVGEAFRDPGLMLAGGECLPEYETAPPDWVARLWKTTEDGDILFAFSLIRRPGRACSISPFFVFGCNLAVRKTALLDSEGFHPDGVPPEYLRFRGDGESAVSEYIQKTGLACRHIPDATVCHYVPKERMTFDYLYRRYFHQAVSDSYTRIRRNGQADWIPHAARLREKILKWLRPDSGASKLAGGRRRPRQMEELITCAYRAGMLYHQREVRQDPRLLEWVLRKDYWDAGLPGES